MLVSPAEGGPLVVLEALAAGIPVVATPVGNLPDLVQRHGELIVSVPIDPSPEQLAGAIGHVPPSRGFLTERKMKAKAKEATSEEQKQLSVSDMHTTARAIRLLADGLTYRMCIERSGADEQAIAAIGKLREAAGKLEGAADAFAKRKAKPPRA